jgi:hypothetical protein
MYKIRGFKNLAEVQANEGRLLVELNRNLTFNQTPDGTDSSSLEPQDPTQPPPQDDTQPMSGDSDQMDMARTNLTTIMTTPEEVDAYLATISPPKAQMINQNFSKIQESVKKGHKMNAKQMRAFLANVFDNRKFSH